LVSNEAGASSLRAGILVEKKGEDLTAKDAKGAKGRKGKKRETRI
jgi:hypothetical protein